MTRRIEYADDQRVRIKKGRELLLCGSRELSDLRRR